MRYSELRRRLAEIAPDPERPSARPDNIFFLKYDRGRGLAWDGVWNIREENSLLEVGFVERGNFRVEKQFSTEEEACDWLYAYLTKPRPPATKLSEREIRSRIAAMHRRIAAEESAQQTDTPEAKDLPWYRRMGRKGDDA